jgi:hypothetical protein
MSECLVYHRYNLDSKTRKVWEDVVSPVLASIATLRAVNKTLKVYVLDTEPYLEDWGDFPSLLDFHVVQQPIQIPLRYDGGCPFQSRMVSRMWDIWSFAQLIPEDIVIYADSDIFWLRDPIPLGNDPVEHFYGDTRGDGFFYFKTRSHGTEVFVNLCRGMILAAIASGEMRTKMRLSGYHTPMLMSEMATMYLVRNGVRIGWGEVDRLEHYFPDKIADTLDPEARCLHAHSGLFGRDRLRVARRVVEFNRAIRSVLTQKEADLMLGTDPPDVEIHDLAQLSRRLTD